MFREFALTLTIAVVVSAIVSLTLTPMMCSRIMRHTADRAAGAVSRFFNRAVDRVVEFYRLSLLWVLRRQTATLLVTFGTLGVTVWLYVIIPKGFLPPQDTGLILAVSEAGTEVSFAQMQRLQRQIEDEIRKDPEVVGVVSIVGVSRMNPTPNAGRLAVTLRSRDVRTTSVEDVVERLKAAVAPVPGMSVYFQPVQDIQISTRFSRAQYQYTLVAASRSDVIEWSGRLVERMRDAPVLRDVVSEAQEGGLSMTVDIDREMGGRLGVSMQAVKLQPGPRGGAERRGCGDYRRRTCHRDADVGHRLVFRRRRGVRQVDRGHALADPGRRVAIYIVLGVLYESFIHPLTILSTLPSAGVGALLALMLFGHDLSVIALIGIILLMGIVKKNAIMMIDFALEAEREQGLSPRDAIVQAALLRFPPDHDDDACGAVRRAAACRRERHRLGAAQPARRHDHRRAAAEPVADALHHARDLSDAGAAEAR
jgi:multidrug efflux pump subunit AcrB